MFLNSIFSLSSLLKPIEKNLSSSVLASHIGKSVPKKNLSTPSISIISLAYSYKVNLDNVIHDRKGDTLDAFNVLQCQVFDELNTSEQGLTTKECLKRQQKYGKNVLPKKKKESVNFLNFWHFFRI